MLIIDLSSNQAHVDFARLKKAGVAAAWLKATEGRTWNDPDWQTRAEQARKARLRVGGYHFARPDLNSPESEAAHFALTLGKIGRRDLRPVLDFEQQTTMRADQLEKWARAFNQEFRNRTGGMTPAFYSYPAYITERMKLKTTIGNGLWLASYGRNDGVAHPFEVPAPWRKAIAHQFTSNAHVAGVQGTVDLSTAARLPLAHPLVGLL